MLYLCLFGQEDVSVMMHTICEATEDVTPTELEVLRGPLGIAVRRGHPGMVKALLDLLAGSGAPGLKPGWSSSTIALWISCAFDVPVVVDVLVVDCAADPNAVFVRPRGSAVFGRPHGCAYLFLQFVAEPTWCCSL
jgi:hypothetical protein